MMQGTFNGDTTTFAPSNNFRYIRLIRTTPLAGVVTINGTPTFGQTLTANTAGITSAAPLGTLMYQWRRNGVNITNATSSTYTLVQADIGANITVEVSAENYGGNITSLPVAITRAPIIIAGSTTPRSHSIMSTPATIDLSAISGLFIVPPGAGARTYTIESTAGGATGTISGNNLIVNTIGTFNIGLATAQTATHAAGAKATATLTVNIFSTSNIIDLDAVTPPATGVGWSFNASTNLYSILNGANVLVINSNATNQRQISVSANATATITLRPPVSAWKKRTLFYASELRN